MQPLHVTSSNVPLTLRDNFVTDPFFLTARQTLERCLFDLYEAHKNCKEENILPCCCCCNAPDQAFQRLGNWMPAVLIPCLHCFSQQVSANQTQNEPRQQQVEQIRLQDTALYLPPGQLSVDKACFELILDVHGFLPQELEVNIKENCVELNARHTEPDLVSSQTISKRYILPCCVNTELAQCSLSKDGILFVTAPWKS